MVCLILEADWTNILTFTHQEACTLDKRKPRLVQISLVLAKPIGASCSSWLSFKVFFYYHYWLRTTRYFLINVPDLKITSATFQYNKVDAWKFISKGMFAIGWLELGEPDRAQLLLEKCFKNIQGPFQVLEQSSDNTLGTGSLDSNYTSS